VEPPSRSIQSAGIGVTGQFKDVTPVPHDGFTASPSVGGSGPLARYTGPKARVSRRLGTEQSSARRARPNRLEKRALPAGRARPHPPPWRPQRVPPPDAGEAEGPFHLAGLSEKRFRNLYEEASRKEGVTGENMLRFLELRLDNVIYRAGWAAARSAGPACSSSPVVMRTFNGRRLDIPSYRVRKGDVVTLRDKGSKPMVVVRWNRDSARSSSPARLEAGDGGLAVAVARLARA